MEYKTSNISLEDLISEVLSETDIQKIINEKINTSLFSSKEDKKLNILQVSEQMLLDSVMEKYNNLKKELTISPEEKEFYQSILTLKDTQEYKENKVNIRKNIFLKKSLYTCIVLFVLAALIFGLIKLILFETNIALSSMLAGLFVFIIFIAFSDYDKERSAEKEAIYDLLIKKYGNIKYSNIKLMLVLFERTSPDEYTLKHNILNLINNTENFKNLSADELSNIL